MIAVQRCVEWVVGFSGTELRRACAPSVSGTTKGEKQRNRTLNRHRPNHKTTEYGVKVWHGERSRDGGVFGGMGEGERCDIGITKYYNLIECPHVNIDYR